MLRVLQQKKRDVLKVRARGDAMVPDHARMDGIVGVRAFIGRVFDRSLAIPGETEGGWRPTVEPQVVSADHHYQYLHAIKHGDLWAADEATAQRAGVPFDPTYGGELAELTDWLGDREAEAKVNAAPAPVAAISAPPAIVPFTGEIPAVDNTDVPFPASAEGKV